MPADTSFNYDEFVSACDRAPDVVSRRPEPTVPFPGVDCDTPQSIPIDALVRADYMRAAGVDSAHVRLLVEAELPLPPILVHRPTMQVIDGFHRIAAAEQAKRATIDAYLIDGPAESMFIVAARANMTHGLPLALVDRRSAAQRIARTHANWSDRAIAAVTGLSAATVKGLRQVDVDGGRDGKRMGRDGRLRPMDASAGRRRAAELLASKPDASLREIATAAGVSPGTVRDVRARLGRGDDPVPDNREADPSQRRADRGSRATPQVVGEPSDVAPVLQTLSKDPALRMNAAGRELLRWLHLHAVNSLDSDAVSAVPDHCVEHLVELASRCAANWARIANDLQNRAQHRPTSQNDGYARAAAELRTG